MSPSPPDRSADGHRGAPGILRRNAASALAFLSTELGGATLLLVAAVGALVWANSPFGAAYERLWQTPLELPVELLGHDLDARGWVTEGAMTFFFLVVALEVKRELVVGELSSRRRALLPLLAALGGMVLPAMLYLAFNPAGSARAGWGIPMATDIAFAVGLVALAGRRVPAGARLFLLAVAIIDDIGAIVVIALFYAGAIAWPDLTLAIGLILAAAIVARRSGSRGGAGFTVAAIALGIAGWTAMVDSGVHATLAGVVFAASVPIRRDGPSPPLAERIEHALHPWTSRVVLPLFALANAGVLISLPPEGPGGRVVFGVATGLVLGKCLGVGGGAWVASKLGWAEAPAGVTWPQVFSVGAIAGIGFTVSLFIAGLAFDEPHLEDAAKLGILVGSVLAATLGGLALRLTSPPPAPPERVPQASPAGR